MCRLANSKKRQTEQLEVEMWCYTEKLKSMQPNTYKFRVIPQFTDEHKSQHLSTVCSCCCNQTFIYTFIYVLDSDAGQLLGTIMKKQAVKLFFLTS